jgi:SAM-dependent methyltransferase
VTSVSEAEYSAIYDPETDFDRWYTTFTARRIAPQLGDEASILEVGSATGMLTSLLCGGNRRFVCIERSAAYVERARAKRLPGVEIVHASIESAPVRDSFDHVLAINVLHEIPQLERVVRSFSERLNPEGVLHVSLPNPHSLHRLVALAAKLISDLREVSERGRRYSTLRLYGADEFAQMMSGWGFEETTRASIMVKPLPNAEMERLPDAVIEAFDAVTATLPDLGSMNYFTFRKARDGERSR